MKILVTGGAGFIGTNLCEALVTQGHSVRVIDNLSVSDANLPVLQKLGVDFVRGDITNYEHMRDAFSGFEVVIHLAAMNRAQRSIEDPLQANKVNIDGTLNCLEASRQNGVSKFINVSSSSVYAQRDGELLQENMALSPLHPYGVGKLAGEHYARVYHELYGLKTLSLRFFSVYGPRQLGSIDKAGVVAKFIHSAVHNQPLEIYGNGKQLRNFSYVGDVVACVLKAIDFEGNAGEVINVANPKEVDINYLAELVQKVSKKDAEIVHVDPLKGDPSRNPADVRKCEALLGYKAQVDFEEGIEKTLAWYTESLERGL